MNDGYNIEDTYAPTLKCSGETTTWIIHTYVTRNTLAKKTHCSYGTLCLSSGVVGFNFEAAPYVVGVHAKEKQHKIPPHKFAFSP